MAMVSLWLTLSLCKFNFHEIDAPTHHGSFPPVVNPRGDPRGDPRVDPRSDPRGDPRCAPL